MKIRCVNLKCGLILGLALLLCYSSFGQIVKGTVVDDETGEGVIGANISVVEGDLGTITDLDGSYQLSLEPGTYNLKVTYIGFKPVEKEITLAANEEYVWDVRLKTDQLSLENVVVTGTFSPRSQKESPISMTYLDANKLQSLSANSQADILRTVPGITAEGGGGEVASNVFVRGMPSGGQYQFTPLQVDGLPVLSTFGLNSSAHDVYFRNDIGIRNLEFVRGGASTLFGAGSVAGIINYSSVTGSNNPERKVQLEWADGGRAKVDFLASGALSEDLFYAVSGFYRYDEGPLPTGLPTKGSQIRGNIKKLFNDGKSSLTVSTQFIDDNVQFFLPYPLANNGGDRERPTGNDGEEIFTLQTKAVRDFSFETPNGRFESPIGDGVSTRGGYLMMDLKHSFANDIRFTSKVKYAKYDHWFNLFLDGDGQRNVPETQADYLMDRELPADATFTYVDNGQPLATGDLLFQNRVLDRERPMEEISGEFNFTKSVVDNGGNTHDLTLGTFVAHTEAEDNNWLWNYLGDFRNQPRLVHLTYNSDGEEEVYSNNGFISGNQTSNNYLASTKYALYLADQIKMDRWSFDIGARVEHAQGEIVKEDGVGTNRFFRGDVSATDFAIAAAALYKLNKSTNLYANFSRGYFFPELRSVAFSSLGNTQSYEPERIIQGELGAKYGQGKLSGTVALFYVGLNDRRSVDFENDPNNPGSVIEIARVQSTQTIGVEMNANYELSPGIGLEGNITYQQHEFTEVEANPEQEGNWLRRQPRIMALGAFNYNRNNVDFRFSYNYLGKKYANDANTVELDPIGIARLDAGYTFNLGKKNETLRLGLSVFNLFDNAGITEGSPRQGNAQIGGGDFFVGRPILPRRIFVRALFNF